MCGIAGHISNSSKSFDISPVLAAMQQRGPDATATYRHNLATLGHTRLSIIDTSSLANQPMLSADGRYALVFNGEIFNYKALKQLCIEYNFITQSDTEVILAIYAKYGIDCVKHLEGQFAFAVWDNVENTLFLGRDRMGEKPLYYYHSQNEFIFASSLKALLKSGIVSKEISEQGLIEYLSFQSVTEPYTIINDVFTLPSGSYALLQNNELNIHTYWTSTDIVPISTSDISYNEAVLQTKDLLTKSVASQMMSDVPLGAFLSGGIDSSVIVALMAECSTQRINTFSIGFEDKKYDESYYAQLLANKYNTKHHAFKLEADFFIQNLPDIFKYMDSPSGDGPNTFLVSKMTKQEGITVALSGLGGDELFVGYKNFLHYYNAQKYSAFWKLPQAFRNAISESVHQFSGFNKVAEVIAQPSPSIEHLYPISRRVYSKKELKLLLPEYKSYASVLKIQLSELSKNFPENGSILSQYSIAEFNAYTKNTLLRDSDAMGMAHSLEIRVPFFDKNLVEFVLALPDEYKYPHSQKRLLVEAMEGKLPVEIYDRPKKGFSFPWQDWLLNEMSGFIQESLEKLSQRGIFEPLYLQSLELKFAENHKNATWSKIWLLVVLENWLQSIDY